jgi:ubiquinone/menaquinone biosynthesis C-methylase UbiE
MTVSGKVQKFKIREAGAREGGGDRPLMLSSRDACVSSSLDTATRLGQGYRAFQCVVVACELKIPDLLANGPKSAAEIASATQTHEPSMRSLMRALCASEVFSERPDGTFAATEVSGHFRSDRPGLRNWLMTNGDWYPAWANLGFTLRTGDNAFVHTFGKTAWEMEAENPEASARFNAAMVESTKRTVGAFVAAYDLAGVQTVVDIGGGNGALLSAVLQAKPEMRGVLFDLRQGLVGAREALEADGVSSRVTLVEGNFFESIPAGGDLYILKRIIHIWTDDQARAILEVCRRSMSSQARLVLLERTIPEHIDASLFALEAAMADLHMRVVAGGQERTTNEYRALLAAAGLRMTRLVPTDGFGIIEAVPA